MSAMLSLGIDFLQHRRSARVGAALLLAGAFVAAASGTWYASVSSDLERVEAQVAEMQRMVRRAPGKVTASPSDAREVQLEARQANAIIQQMTVPWDRLFSELELSANKDVALLALQPDVDNRILRISGEAKNLNAMLAYSRRLESSDMLSSVVLLGHEVKSQDPQRPVVFALSAGWSEQP